MSEYPKDSFNKPNLHRGVTPEQIPHSGKHGNEFPVREFDNTSLIEASDRGLIATPESASEIFSDSLKSDAQLIQEERELLEQEERNGSMRSSESDNPFARFLRTKAGKITAGIAGVAVVAGAAGAAVGFTNGNSQNSPTKPQTTSEPVTPNTAKPVTPESGVPSVQSLEVKAGQAPEATATALADLISKWGMAGTDKATFEGQFGDAGLNLNMSQYIEKVATANATAYAEATYGPSYNDPEFASSISFLKNLNIQILQANYQTHGTQNTEAYSQYEKFAELTLATPNDDGTETYNIILTQDDNGNLNIVGPTGLDGFKSSATFITQEANGVIHVTAPIVFAPIG